ncbi:MAG: caspase family protein [Rhizobiaceae bacterium]|nr:caspase family protein [Rhizobiaceae bacterium]
MPGTGKPAHFHSTSAPFVALAAVVFFLAATVFAVAQEPLRGVALVIGNGDYEHLTPLANPPDDADAIEALLDDLGFDSVRRTDRDAEDLARDLERFVEDAEDADVAILYYAGHGIEAGGENWLVPVDADLSALDAAAVRLVPVSHIVRRLRETVPVTIVLLDACRDNPFPADATLRLAADAEPLPVSAGGLVETGTRGATSLLSPQASSTIDNLGTVIGFAAAPGQVALDGEAGGSSPYAAALARHISAMAGEEFGTVMRMVAEEVYLKTDGAQRPWVNESLRRLLYFGEAPDPVAGPEGEILTERRGLLLTISTLPDFSRQQVERIAGQVGVPMDAVYGMLKVLGADTPDDPVELERLLRQQTEQLKSFLADRRVIENPDPELARLSALTDQAVAEGAIETARRLRDEADRRIEELSTVIEREEDLIRARRIEFAAEYAKSAEIDRLAFDNAGAAEDFGKAYEQIARWDDLLAWEYRKKQIDNLLTHNRMHGDPQSLERAVAMAEALIGLAATLGDAERGQSRTTLASVRYAAAHAIRDYNGYFDALAEVDAALALLPPGENRARALGQRGFMLGNIASYLQEPDRFEESISSYRQALTEVTREENAQLWKDLQGELGNQLAQLAMHRLDPAPMREAIDIYDQSMELAVADNDPINRIFFQLQLAMFRIALPKIQNPDGVDAETAAAIHAELEANLAELNPEQFPLATGLLEHSIAWVLTSKANFLDDPTETLAEAVSSLRRALRYRTRDKAPGEWAETQELLATTLRSYAFHTQDAETYREAVAAFEDALSVYSAAGALQRWAPLKAGLIGATRELGIMQGDMATLGQAAAIARDALTEPALSAAPHLRFDISQELTRTLWELYTRDRNLGHLEEQIAVFDAELPDIDPDERTDDYIAALTIIGDAAGRLGRARSDAAWHHRAIEANEPVLVRHDREDRQHFANVSYDTAISYLNIADREGDVDAIHRALGHFDLAVEYSDPTDHPTEYANALADRATAHHRLYNMEKDPARFDAALAGYREATAIHERQDQPGFVGIHLRNLGLLYLAHDEASGSIDMHDEAIAVLREAMAADSRAGFHFELLRAATKLGDALWGVAAASGEWDHLSEAVEAYRTATSVPPDQVSAHELAVAHHWHAMALRTLAAFENDDAMIEQAAEEFRTAIALRAGEAGSGAWYETQAALANVLLDLAQRSDGTEHLAAALDSYDAMLRHYADDWTVMGAADLHMKRGNMLRLMGDRGSGAEQYRAAADAYREALRLAEGEDAPDFHVGVRRNLGEALRRLGGATDDMVVLRDAADAFRTALALIPDDGSQDLRALTRRELGLTLSTLGDAGGDTAALEESIEHLTAATGYYSREANPKEWAYLANNIAWLEIVAGRRDGEVERFERAARDLRDVVAVQREIKDEADLGLSEDSLCAALYELGKARSDSAALEEAAQACASAIAHLRKHGQDTIADGTEALLAQVEVASTELR